MTDGKVQGALSEGLWTATWGDRLRLGEGSDGFLIQRSECTMFKKFAIATLVVTGAIGVGGSPPSAASGHSKHQTSSAGAVVSSCDTAGTLAATSRANRVMDRGCGTGTSQAPPGPQSCGDIVCEQDFAAACSEAGGEAVKAPQIGGGSRNKCLMDDGYYGED